MSKLRIIFLKIPLSLPSDVRTEIHEHVRTINKDPDVDEAMRAAAVCTGTENYAFSDAPRSWADFSWEKKEEEEYSQQTMLC